VKIYIWDDWKNLTVQELLDERQIVKWVLYESSADGDRKKMIATILLRRKRPLGLTVWNRKAKRLKTPYPKKINRY
jgi:hypothetical protein